MSVNNNKVIAAFQEDLDCSPIYLGKDKTEGSFWFYALKAGTARFLKYVNYFHWDRGPQAILTMIPLPAEIEQELTLFLEGQVEYEFAKKRSNSREFSIRKHYRIPAQLGIPDGGQSPTTDVPGGTDAGGAGVGIATAGGSSVWDESTRNGRRKHRLSKSFGVPAEPATSVQPARLKQATVSDKKPVTVENPPIGTVSVTRKRFTVQGVLDLAEKIESPANLEQQHAKDGLELGHLGLLTPVVLKKRGRPKKT